MTQRRIAISACQTDPDLNRAVGRLMSQLEGHGKALPLAGILAQLQILPVWRHTTIRQLRAALEDLRAGGMLICSDSEGGHWLAADMSEYQSFRAFYTSYARTIFTRAAAMDSEAERRFKASALQDRLI